MQVASSLMYSDDFDSASTSASDEFGEALIADRLDALETEKVIRRALELEAESLDQPHMFDAEQLMRIAKEIDMNVDFVRQALGEVRLSPTARTRFDRWILPEDIIEVASIEGLDRAEVDAAIDRWMTGYEGLIRSGALPDGSRWDIDRRLSTRLRAWRRSGGNRISRVSGGDVAHRVHSISGDEHVVAMQAEGEGPLVAAKAAIVVAVLAVFFGMLGSLGDGFWPFLQALAAFAVIGTGIVGAGVLGARRWARGIGRALRRSLTGLVADAKPIKRGWRDRFR